MRNVKLRIENVKLWSRFAATALILHFTLYTFHSFAASPAATQAWVRQYVARSGRATWAPVTRSLVINGTNVTIRFSFSPMTNAALRVESSGDPKMPAGVCFAKTAPGLYQNLTNRYCDAIMTSRVLSSISVATNSAPWRTNYNYTAWAEFSVDGVVYKGARQGSRYVCHDPADLTTNRAEIVVAPCALTDAARAAALTPPPSVSWLSLLVGSAYAEWRLGEKVYTGEREWERHYVWQGDGSEPAAASVKIFVGDESFDVPLSDPLVIGYYDGLDACDAKKYADEFNLSDERLADQLKAWLDDIADWLYVIFGIYQEDFWDIYNYDQDASAYLDPQLAASLPPPPVAPPECPVTGEDPEEVKEEEPPPKPTPTPGGGCNHSQYGATGHCGAWRCANCGAAISGGPSGHNFVEAEGDCQKCMNKFKNAVCRASDTNPYHHFYGKDYGGDENGCICKHGGFTIPHPGFAIADDGRWRCTAAVHWQMEECSRCPFQRQTNKASHGSAEGKWEDTGNGTCVFVQKCPTCSYEFSRGTPSPHVPGEPNGSITDEGSAGHAIHKKCSRCGANDGGSEVLPHTYANDDAADATWTDNGDNHERTKTCDFPGCGHTEPETAPHEPGAPSGEPQDCDRACRHPKERHNGHAQKLTCAAKGCGHDMGLGTPVPHEWTYQLSKTPAKQDTRTCETCGHTDAVDHEWTFDSSIHYCTQGGQMHLYGLHEGDPCSCGWSAGYHIEKAVFSCGGCFREIVVDSNGDPVPGATEHINCDYYGSGSDNCACPMCTVGLYSLCWCCFRIGDGKVEWRMQSTSGSGADPAYMTNSLAKSFVGSVSTENNADCREVADNYFAGGFDGFAALESADFQYATNAGEYAFAGAFSNCAALASVRFDRLQTADFYAFAGAFQGCPNLGALVFPSLDSISYWTFLGCGATNYVFSAVTNIEDLALQGISGRMSFPSLRTTCAHAFAGCTAALDLPGLKTVREFGFAEYGHGDLRLPAVTNFVHADGAFTSSSVTNLHLPRVTTNALLSAMEDAFAPSLLYPSFGLRSGCRVHCSDGIIVVP